MSYWISVEDKLPEKSETWKEYLIAVFPPYIDRCLVTTAMYDSRQKIWHLSLLGEEQTINAIIPPCDVDGGETTITHWMPLPEPPGKRRIATETCLFCGQEIPGKER